MCVERVDAADVVDGDDAVARLVQLLERLLHDRAPRLRHWGLEYGNSPSQRSVQGNTLISKLRKKSKSITGRSPQVGSPKEALDLEARIFNFEISPR